MENRFLFSTPRRRKWPRKNPSFVRVMAISRDSIKAYTPIVSQPSHSKIPPSALENTIATMIFCIREYLSTYSVYEFLGHWTMVLLYTPFEFGVTITNNVCKSLLNLPPFFTLVVLPLLLSHLLYRLARIILEEYQTFLDLGRGGTPSTPMGLIKVTMKRFFARVDVLDPPHVDPMLEPYRGILFDQLKPRKGDRPVVKGVAPQRQFDQKASLNTFNTLLQMLKDTADTNENLKVTTSYLEGHTDALKGVFADLPHEVWGTDGEWDYEIAHPHRNDGSLHAILHPEDVRTVIERGWGERHPLATDAWWWKIFYHYIRMKRRPTPYNLVLVYAPRQKAEFAEVQKIVNAAVWFHEEKAICDKINQGLLARADCGAILTREQATQYNNWVDGPDGKLMTLERALDRGLYKITPCGTGVMSTFPGGTGQFLALPPSFKANVPIVCVSKRSVPIKCEVDAGNAGGCCG